MASMNLSLGSSGSAVTLLQTLLYTAGYDIGPTGVDGKFGANTQAAVQKFQSDHGLTVDGIVGPETAAALGLDLTTGGAASAATSAATGDSGTTATSSTTSRWLWWGIGGSLLLKPWRWFGFGKKS